MLPGYTARATAARDILPWNYRRIGYAAYVGMPF